MKKIDISIHNDFFDEVSNNLKKYDYNLLFEIAVMSIGHRKKIIDYLFKEMIHISYDDVMLLKTELIDCNLYNDYKKSILNGNDNFLKTCLVLYFEQDLKDDLYEDNMTLAKTVIKCDEDYLLISSNLLNISQFICDDNTIKFIKDNMNRVIHDGLENKNEEDINKIVEKYYNIIDYNQMALNEEYSLVLNG